MPRPSITRGPAALVPLSGLLAILTLGVILAVPHSAAVPLAGLVVLWRAIGRAPEMRG